MPVLAKDHARLDEVECIFETLPNQGNWTEEEYLQLTDASNRLVEFTDGFLEPLPMPTNQHQRVFDRRDGAI